MKNGMQLAFRRGDLLAIALVAVLAVCTFLAFAIGNPAGQSRMVQIYRDGELMRELSLQTDETLQIAGEYTNTVTIQDGRAAITASNCPGEDCVHSGWISEPGRSIVCLPNRVELRITGSSDADVDFAVG